MFRKFTMVATAISLGLSAVANASDAATSATVGGFRGSTTGVAAASARYVGDIGFARTTSHSGSLNLARGVAVGFDEDGLSLSVSNAVATRHGPAIATNFNLTIGRDGDVSSSSGLAVANGPIHREASAGGSVGTGPGRAATSIASGKSDRFGRVVAETRAEQRRGHGRIRVRG